MEFAAGGDLHARIVKAGRFSEDVARYFFQQLVQGVAWCHSKVGGGGGLFGWLVTRAKERQGGRSPGTFKSQKP